MKSSFTASRLEAGPSLSSILVAKLREEIGSRRLDVGSRFPTDAEIADAYGVSRTVVREAVSALRAEGLVSTQRGRGSVVSSRLPTRPFGITQEEINSLEDVLKIFELRSALETRIAALAAERRSEEDLPILDRCVEEIDRAIDRGEDAIDADINLHLNIASATRNDYFPRLLGSFKSLFIARRRVRSDLKNPDALKNYLQYVQGQHREIVDAIRKRDPERAGSVMSVHLDGSRYRKLLKES